MEIAAYDLFDVYIVENIEDMDENRASAIDLLRNRRSVTSQTLWPSRGKSGLASQQVAHYRIIEKLGTGGMGEVFLAQDLKLGRKVAIKMLPAKSIDDALARKRLLREAKAAATLDHPNICAIHEVNEDGDCPFIVMQYVEGNTLAIRLLESALSPEEVIDVGVQAAEALVEAHSRGVVHRDIKPQNIIITPRGQVKVLD